MLRPFDPTHELHAAGHDTEIGYVHMVDVLRLADASALPIRYLKVRSMTY
jgi:hypothetical protein